MDCEEVSSAGALGHINCEEVSSGGSSEVALGAWGEKSNESLIFELGIDTFRGRPRESVLWKWAATPGCEEVSSGGSLGRMNCKEVSSGGALFERKCRAPAPSGA